MPARSNKRPDISDIDGFTEFIYNKWQKLARRAQLKDWSERRYAMYDNYIQKLINKMKKGEENCDRVIDKIQQGIEDEETSALRRRRAAGDEKRNKNKDEKDVKKNDDDKEDDSLLAFDPEAFRRTLMHEFHKKVSEAEAKRKKQGARSSLTHWLTHIMRKLKQILEYHVMECTVTPVDHENLTKRYENLRDRRAKLHVMGENLIKKSKAYFERQAKKSGDESS